MLIIAGYLEVEPSRRDDYVAAHSQVVRQARRTDGCLDLAISADPTTPGRINLHERWASQDALDAWRGVAPSPNTDVPITGGDVAKYVIDRVEPAF